MNLTIFKYAFMRCIKSPATFIFCLIPIVFMFIIDFDGTSTGPLFLGLFMMIVAYQLAKSIQADKFQRTVFRILSGPVTMRSYFVQNFFSSFIPTAIISFVVGGLGMLLHDWSFPVAAGFTLSYILLGSTAIGISYVFACLWKTKETSSTVSMIIIMLMAMIGGLMLPQSIMPDALFYFGALFPTHWAARAIESVVAYNNVTEPIYWISLGIMAVFTAIFLVYGSKRRIV